MTAAPAGGAARPEVTIVDTDRGPVELARWGAGPAVLAVHGTPGSWRQLATLAADLAPELSVLAPSRPGYGRTPQYVGRSPAQQADAYRGVLDALGIERAAVIGVSGGGPSAVALAAHHGSRVSSLVLCCAVVPRLMHVPAGMRAVQVPGVAEGLAVLERAVGRALVRRRPERLVRRQLTPTEDARFDGQMLDDFVRFLHSHLDAPAARAAMRNDLREFRRVGAADPAWLAGIEAPTLVLHGTADAVVGFEHGKLLAATIPGARLIELPDAGHGFLITCRDEATAAIRAHLREHAGGG